MENRVVRRPRTARFVEEVPKISEVTRIRRSPEVSEAKLPIRRLPTPVEAKPPIRRFPTQSEDKPSIGRSPTQSEDKPPIRRLPTQSEDKPPIRRLPTQSEDKPPIRRLPETQIIRRSPTPSEAKSPIRRTPKVTQPTIIIPSNLTNITQKSPPKMVAPILSKYPILYDEENVPYIPLPKISKPKKIFDYDSEQPIEILNNYNLTLDMIVPNAQGSYEEFLRLLDEEVNEKYSGAFDIMKLLNMKFLEKEFKGLIFNELDNPKFSAEVILDGDLTYGRILYEVAKSLPVDYELYFPKFRHFEGLRKVGDYYELIIS
jgi:hypothetical protein